MPLWVSWSRIVSSSVWAVRVMFVPAGDGEAGFAVMS